MSEPTEADINRGIAECMGMWWESFTTSHDACHLALERMTEEQVGMVRDELFRIACCDGLASTDGGIAYQFQRWLLLVKPPQLALAIYRVVKGDF